MYNCEINASLGTATRIEAEEGIYATLEECNANCSYSPEITPSPSVTPSNTTLKYECVLNASLGTSKIPIVPDLVFICFI